MKPLDEVLHRTLEKVYPELTEAIQELMEQGHLPETIIELMKEGYNLNDHQIQFITVSAHYLRRQNSDIIWLPGSQ